MILTKDYPQNKHTTTKTQKKNNKKIQNDSKQQQKIIWNNTKDTCMLTEIERICFEFQEISKTRINWIQIQEKKNLAKDPLLLDWTFSNMFFYTHTHIYYMNLSIYLCLFFFFSMYTKKKWIKTNLFFLFINYEQIYDNCI